MKNYTVKKLADLSGVSVRTLHWYDSLGLLSPAYKGPHGERYYEKKQLLLLQQILFYRELGFPLEKIKEIFERPDFDLIKALLDHQKKLEEKIKTTHQLIITIQSTIQDLREEQKIEEKELYRGFREWSEEQKEDGSAFFIGKYIEEKATEAEMIVLQSIKDPHKTAHWTKEDWEVHSAKTSHIFKGLVQLMNENYSPSDPEVQKIIKTHYEMIKEFHHLTPKIYMAYAELYLHHPKFKLQLDPYHKNLSAFMANAMKSYCRRG